MTDRSIAVSLSSIAAAGALLLIGVFGLVGPRRVIGLDGSSTLATAADSTTLEAKLGEREFSLDQQRQAEVLLQDFTRGQMTRHYWGSFADSLVELGLSPMEQANTTVRSDDRSTKLWIEPRRGDTAYLALVERQENRLFTRYCKGDRDDVLKPFPADCPPSWLSLDIPETRR